MDASGVTDGSVEIANYLEEEKKSSAIRKAEFTANMPTEGM